MAVVGVAEILIQPSFKGTQREIGKEMAGVQDSGSVKKAGSGLGRVISAGLKTGAVAGVAALGVALTKGFGRLQAIENAKASLAGLGHSAQSVEQIMNDASTAVKGTAFGLGEAAGAAAQMVAAGVKPGKDLSNTLTLIGDAATIAGTDFSSMSAIFGKAAASNKVQMDIINQLHDAGVPALQLIAKEMGVTAEEASTMASKGKVDFATFERAMTEGLGGAAQKSGETLQGAFANSMAAVGRFGANLMSGVYPQITEFFSGFIGWMGPLEEKAKVVGDALGVFLKQATDGIKGVSEILLKGDFSGVLSQAFGIEEDHPFVNFLFNVREGLMGTGEWIKNNRAWLEPLTVAVVVGAAAWKLYNWTTGAYTKIGQVITGILKGQTIAQWALNSALLANPIGLVVAAVVGLVAAFIYLWNTNEGFRNFFINAWEGIKNAVGVAGDFITGVFSAIGDWVTGTLGPVFQWLNESVIQPVWNAITGATESAGGVIGSVVESIGGFFTWLNDSVIQPVWSAITGAISTATDAIGSALSAVGDFLTTVFGPVFEWLYNNVIKPIWGLIQWQIDFVSNVLLFLFDLIVYTVKNVLAPAFTWLYENVIKPVWESIKTAVSVAWAVLKAIFGTLVTVVRETLALAFTWLRDSVIKPVWTAIQTTISVVWAVIKTVFMTIVNTVRNTLATVFTWLYNTIIKPVWDGIKWFINRTWTGIKVIFNAIKSFINDTLAPAFRWFYDNVIKPVWDGIKNTIKNVWENGIKPVFKSFGDFIEGTVAPAFKKGVKIIGDAWEGIKKAAGTPVHFVLETIYNQGIKGTFDKVAKAIGSDARLPGIDTSGIPHFAKGGQMKHGWKLVGEEGPELINTGPGYVYTANETKRMLAGQSQMPMGAINEGQQAHNGIGGFWSNAWGGIKSVASSVGGTLKKGLDWVRGGLAKAAEFVLNPIKDSLSGVLGSDGFSGLWSKVASNNIDGVLDWIRGKDTVEDGGPMIYDGPLGSFSKPANGRITSGFGASRGKYPHAGIDFAVGIGSAVRAMLNGVVRKTGVNAVSGRTGKGMVLDHANGLSSYYGHLNAWGKKPGDRVEAGERIASSGNTGNSTGPHLHAELWNGGKPFNFMSYLYDNGGVLPTGLRMIANASNKPEAILSNSQWKNMSTLANQAAQNMGGGSDAESMRYALHGMEIKMQTESGTVFAKLVNKGVNDLTRGKKSILS